MIEVTNRRSINSYHMIEMCLVRICCDVSTAGATLLTLSTSDTEIFQPKNLERSVFKSC